MKSKYFNRVARAIWQLAAVAGFFILDRDATLDWLCVFIHVIGVLAAKSMHAGASFMLG
jgi:hypothetical protein